MKSLEELRMIRETAKKDLTMREENSKKYRVVVGMATCGIAAGARPVLTALVDRVASKKYDASVLQTGCIGMCKLEPMVEVYEGDVKTTYVLVDAKKAKKIADYHLGKGEVVEEYTIGYVMK